MPAADLVHDCRGDQEFCLRLDGHGHINFVIDTRYPDLFQNTLPRDFFFLTHFYTVRIAPARSLVQKKREDHASKLGNGFRSQ